MYITSYLFVILSIYLQNKEQLFVPFPHTIFVFIAPNLVYLHNLDIKKVGSVNGTSVLLHLSHYKSL